MASNKIYRLVRPQSLTDENYAEYEYLIRWIGRDGSEYLYMFLDAEFNTGIRGDVINEIDEDRIESLVDSENNSVTLKADDLSQNDLLVIGELMACKYVTRIKLDGTIERYAPDTNSYRFRPMGYRYGVEFRLIMPGKVVWK